MKWWVIAVMAALQLLIVVVAGVILHFLESDNGFKEAQVVEKKFTEFKNKHPCLSSEKLHLLYSTINKASDVRLLYRHGEGFSGTSWDFLSSTYSAFQVISSIGFGSSPPQSTGGKIFLIFYVLIGIPVFVCVVFGFGVQLLALSDWVRRCFWRSAGIQDYVFVHVLRTFILLLIGFFVWCLVPAAIFKAFDKDLDYWNTVAIISVLFVGPGEFTPAQLKDPTSRQWYRLVVGLWTLCYMLWFSGTLATTYRIIIEYYDEDGVYIPKSLTMGDQNMAIVSRLWVNQEDKKQRDNLKKEGIYSKPRWRKWLSERDDVNEQNLERENNFRPTSTFTVDGNNVNRRNNVINNVNSGYEADYDEENFYDFKGYPTTVTGNVNVVNVRN